MMKRYKYLDLIILLDVVVMAIVNITAGKIVEIGIFALSAASLCIPINNILSDIFTEVYGYKQARRVTWILIFSTILTAILLQLAVWLPPAPGFNNNDAYIVVLGQVPRIAISGWIALFLGQFINDFVLSKMKLLTNGKYLWTRTISSTMAGQAAETISFYSIAFYNVISADLLIKSILSAWFLKVLIEASLTPFTYMIVNKLKKAENEDYFDKGTNFNPLIIDLKQSRNPS